MKVDARGKKEDKEMNEREEKNRKIKKDCNE